MLYFTRSQLRFSATHLKRDKIVGWAAVFLATQLLHPPIYMPKNVGLACCANA